MANVQHSALTDTDGIHEPKGITTALTNQLYMANGSSSGNWKDASLLPGTGWGYYTNSSYTGTTYFTLTTTKQVIPFNLKSIETNLPIDLSGNTSTLLLDTTSNVIKFVSAGDLMAITFSFNIATTTGTPNHLDLQLYGSSDGTTYATLLAEKTPAILKTAAQTISETTLIYVTTNMATYGAKISCALNAGTASIKDISLISARLHKAR
jgi:hypothetical protein